MFVVTVCFGTVFTSCGKKEPVWNPDQQFAGQRQVLEAQRARAQRMRWVEARDNVKRLRADLLDSVLRGMTLRQLEERAGELYILLARETGPDGAVWERRRYLFSHAVSSAKGPYSLEYQLCDKEEELFTVTVANGVVRVVDRGF